MKSNKNIRLIIIFLLGFFLGSLFIRLQDTNNISVENDVVKTKYNQFKKIYSLLDQEYYEPTQLDFENMINQATKKFVDSVGDPYTVFMTKEENLDFQDSLKGENELEGIGAVASKKEYYVQIEEVIKGAPASKAGLRALDRITEIDGRSVKDEAIDEAISRLRGVEGSKVYLTIEREINKNLVTFQKEIIREKIVIPSVKSNILQTKNGKEIAYIEIFLVGDETSSIFKKEIELLKQNDLHGVILDLRSNGGGYMAGAIEIASYFLDKGDAVLATEYQAYPNEIEYSKGYSGFQNHPIIVLVDGNTASAGEIIALALKENKNATVIGTQTFGKGSIQVTEELKDFSLVKYSVGKRFSPSGISIDKEGLKPDIELEFDIDNYIKNNTDNQLEKALEIISE